MTHFDPDVEDFSSASSSSSFCGPGTSCSSSGSPSLFTALFSLSPVLLTFTIVASLASSRLFPYLATTLNSQNATTKLAGGGIALDDGHGHLLPTSAPPSLRQAHAELAAKSPARRLRAAAFSSLLGLSAVLAELILAEVLDVDGAVLGPHARGVALRFTVPALLLLLVGVVPLLEAQSVLASRGWRFGRDGRGRLVSRGAWIALGGVFAAWLVAFWYIGRAVSRWFGGLVGDIGDEELWRVVGAASAAAREGTGFVDTSAMTIGRAAGFRGGASGRAEGGFSRGCLERIGVIGIALMALLSGFASVSSPWHTFVDSRAYRKRPVTDADIARKQAGLDATSELLMTKKHRLRSLQRKADAFGGGAAHGETPNGSSGFMGKVVGSLKNMVGSGEAAEIRALQMEISGLEAMESNLAASLAILKSQQAAHARDGTPLGRLLAIPQYAFASYCVYRILATLLTTLKRAYYPAAAFSSSDPINRFLGLLARHWDPKLDQLAWARTISFLLSGVILAASANSVVQTFRLFAKWAPGLLYQAQANLPLLVAQVAATYVISSALLLRSSLPHEVGRSVSDALSSPLQPAFVDRWFEVWFLLASATTLAGIWLGRKFTRGSATSSLLWDEWDEFAGEEMGIGQKRS